MSKFRVGDKVEIVDPIFDCDNKYKGFLVTISKTLGVDRYEVLENPRPWCDSELKLVARAMPTLEYIDDYMDTSNRPVVDLSDHAVDSLYPNIINTETWKNLYDKYVSGIWEKEEEKDMNKVVDLWYNRKKENIYKKYKDLEDKYVKEHYEIVKQYNELIEDFEKNLEDFCTEYSDITVNDDFIICKNADCNVYKYVIDESVIRNDAKITYKEDKNKEYKELQLKCEDLNALLSMSDDLEYQQSILIEYGIINKKTKRMINEDNSN